jgi:cob(I)alamin adenosyltransferase
VPRQARPPRRRVPTLAQAATRRDEAYRRKVSQAKRRKGLLIVHTGNGKGKSTAAWGLMTRAWGRGMKVGVVQFLKSATARFGEVRAAQKMGIDWAASGDGFTWTSRDLSRTEALARRGWEIAREWMARDYDVLILDEFTYPLTYGWLDVAEVLAWVAEHKPPKLHLVITGRDAPKALVAAADLVTEMREVKHPFKDQGVVAQPGVEF